MSILIPGLVFLAVLLAYEGVRELSTGRRAAGADQARKRLHQLADRLQADTPEARLLKSKTKRGWMQDLVAALPNLASLELLLYRAGIAIDGSRFVVLCLGAAAAGAALVWFQMLNPTYAPLGLVLGGLPLAYAYKQQRSRMALFEKQFPEALALIVRSLRAGHAITSGMQIVGQDLPDPVSSEFQHISDEIKLGQETRQALSNMAHRIDSDDVAFFVTALMIQRETGGNLAEILENLEAIIRDRLDLYGKIRAVTAQVRASALILALMPLAVGAVFTWLKPEAMSMLWETPQGHQMVAATAVLSVVGYIVCRKVGMVRI